MRKLFYVFLFALTALSSKAGHLVGGEMTYECTGNGTYRISLRIYRDCNSSGADFDTQAAITVFTSTGAQYRNLSVSHGPTYRLPATVNNPCLQSPPNVCTEYTDYTTTVSLPPRPGGYTITYQRCCRNNTISNIPNPGDWGNTYTIDIPSNDSCNSSPAFKTVPPIVLCLNDPLNYDAGVTETDGDSIFYQFCSPLHGGGKSQASPGTCLTCPAPNPAAAPPYTNVPFLAPQSASDPIPSTPTISIDPNTGLITGTPTMLGQFVFAICVEEYRNGQLLSTVRRDYQFNVTNCSSNVRSGIESQILNPGTICAGTTIQFEEEAVNATTYFWDFGDPSTNADTSNVANPSYTYNDTGTYTVTLIVNRGYPCSDSSSTVFEVRHPVTINVTKEGSGCLDGNGLELSVQGNFSSDAEFTWTFPPQASIQTDNTANPPPITFSAEGTYYIELTVEDFGCINTYGDSVSIGIRPEFDATIPDAEQCAPYLLDLQHSAISSNVVHYEWVFGDGNTSSDENPEYVYENSGVYSGYLLMYTTRGCTDSALYPFQITVFPSPDAELELSPEKTDIFEPYVNISVIGISSDDNFVVYTGDGATYTSRTNIYHRYGDTGTYNVELVIENEFGCEVTKVYPFRVAPVPLIYTPTAFTPNGDGLNDEFRAVSSGYKQYRFEIFDRWGNCMFSSYNSLESWDGTNQLNGKLAPEGTYVWIVKFLGTEGDYIERRGTVTLMR